MIALDMLLPTWVIERGYYAIAFRRPRAWERFYERTTDMVTFYSSEGCETNIHEFIILEKDGDL